MRVCGEDHKDGVAIMIVIMVWDDEDWDDGDVIAEEEWKEMRSGLAMGREKMLEGEHNSPANKVRKKWNVSKKLPLL